MQGLCVFYKYMYYIVGEHILKLEDIGQEKIKPRTIRASDKTIRQLKIVGAYTKRNQEQVLKSLLKEELKRLDIHY